MTRANSMMMIMMMILKAPKNSYYCFPRFKTSACSLKQTCTKHWNVGSKAWYSLTINYFLQEHEKATEHKRHIYLFLSPLERVVADGKPDRKGELEKMCVMLVDPSLPAGVWCTTGITPPPPPLFTNTETHSLSRSALLQLWPCWCREGWQNA